MLSPALDAVGAESVRDSETFAARQFRVTPGRRPDAQREESRRPLRDKRSRVPLPSGNPEIWSDCGAGLQLGMS